MPEYLSDQFREKLIDEDFNALRARSAELSAPEKKEETVSIEALPKGDIIPEQVQDNQFSQGEGFWNLLRTTGRDIGQGVMESPRQLIGGAREGAQDVIEGIYKGGQFVQKKLENIGIPDWVSKGRIVYDNGKLRYSEERPSMPVLPQIKEATTKTGGIIRSIAEFASVMMPVSRGMKAAGLAGNLLRSAASGAVADVVVTKQGDANLSDLVQKYPSLKNPVTEYLSSKPDDTLAETKFKAAVEGLGVGAMTDVLMGGLRILKSAKAAPTIGHIAIDDGVKQLQKPLAEYVMATKGLLSSVPDTVSSMLAPQIERLEGLPAKLMDMRKAGITSAQLVNELEMGTNSAIKSISGIVNQYAPDSVKDINKLTKKVEKVLSKTQSKAGELASRMARNAAFETRYQELVGNPNETVVDMAGNINMAHIQAEDDVKKVIQEMSNDPSIRGIPKKQSHKATQELADQIGVSIEDFKQLRSGKAMTAEELLASRNMMNSSAVKLRDLAKLVSEGGGDAEKMALYRQIAVHRAIQGEVVGATQEAGRALSQFNIAARQTSGDIKAINNFVQSLEQGEIGIDKIAASITMMDDPIQVAKFLSKPEELSNIEAFVQWRTAALLTSPKTHVVNMLSNTLNTFWQIPERMLASHMKPKNPGELVQKGEWTALAMGAVDGFIDAIRLARKWEFWQAGGSRHEAMQVTNNRSISRETYPALGIVSDYIGKAINIPMKALGAEDEIFKTIASRAELHAQAFRKASVEGLSGDAMAKRISELIDNPTDIMKGQSQDFSKYVTFQQDLEGAMKGASQWIQSSPWMRLVVPFIKTPSNIWLETVERSPLAPFLKTYKNAIKEGGAEAQIAMAKYKMGTGLMASVGVLKAAGYMSGGGPTDKGERTGKMTTGWQPYSVKIGDKWISYNRLEPISGVLALAADAVDVVSNINDSTEAEGILRDIGLVMGHYLDDRTYFKGIAQMLDAVFNPNMATNLIELGKNIAMSGIPPGQVGPWINQQSDPIMRDARDWMDQLFTRTPGLSKHVPPKRDAWGEPIKVKSAIGPDALSPFVYSEEKGDKLSKLILDNDLEINMPKRALNFGGHGDEGIKLNADEYDKYAELSGKMAKSYLKPMAGSLKNSPKEVQQLNINKIFEGSRKNAQHHIYNMFPDLKERVDNRRTEFQSSRRKNQ